MPWTFWKVLLTIVGSAILSSVGFYLYTPLKWSFKVDGHSWKDKLRTIHVNGLWRQFHDTELNPKVSYARHTISIDENRANFKRVEWSSPPETHWDANGLRWSEQVWFFGNRSDIGGS